MAHNENLIPIGSRPPEEQFAICSAGGKAAAAARRKVKAMREAAQILLSAPLIDEDSAETADLLYRLGLEPDQQGAILVQLIRQAKAGDIRSAQFVRDLSMQGEKGHKAAVGIDLRGMTTEELERILTEEEEHL